MWCFVCEAGPAGCKPENHPDWNTGIRVRVIRAYTLEMSDDEAGELVTALANVLPGLVGDSSLTNSYETLLKLKTALQGRPR